MLPMRRMSDFHTVLFQSMRMQCQALDPHVLFNPTVCVVRALKSIDCLPDSRVLFYFCQNLMHSALTMPGSLTAFPLSVFTSWQTSMVCFNSVFTLPGSIAVFSLSVFTAWQTSMVCFNLGFHSARLTYCVFVDCFHCLADSHGVF